MINTTVKVAEVLQNFDTDGEPVQVSLSNELVGLLSDQLYQSPVKAIEELVVNSYDADAKECYIYVPTPDDDITDFVIIYDDGIGMNKDGLVNLWQIGRSDKRTDEVTRRQKRKLIGRFGIGKLATYTIANRLTYISKSHGKILSISIDFRNFTSSSQGSKPINLPVREITSWHSFEEEIKPLLDKTCININNELDSWTITILEDLKTNKIKKLTPNLLHWILSTAMPYASDFKLFLNCEEVRSAKEEYERYCEFNLSDLPSKRLQSLCDVTHEQWQIRGNALFSPSFPNGVTGKVIVTKKTLIGTKSDDIARSHGFFVRVRGRLVNTSDPLFVEKALIHGVFNRFRADIEANDLDSDLKASREAFEDSTLKDNFRSLLREVFNEAVSRYEAEIKKENEGKRQQEGDKQIVAPRLVEYPVADALIEYSTKPEGTEANDSWFYLEIDNTDNLSDIAQKLYLDTRSRYLYKYRNAGKTARLVMFDPKEATFWINQNHELALEYTDGQSKLFLEDFVTSEVMLEIYLREAQIPAHIAGEVLERRDLLLRSLARDHSYSLKTIADSLRSAAADERELEILLVVAARALGFVASHVSNSGKPDGIARFSDYPQGEKKITLEAKSSKDVPSLSAIDFAGLYEHVQKEIADGCLLVAPNYPGSDNAAAATRARQLRISCWTVDQLASFIESVESHQINAKALLDIVLNNFSPLEVEKAIDKLLIDDTSNHQAIYSAVLEAIETLEPKLKDSQRTIDMIAAVLSVSSNLDITVTKVTDAIKNLANASQGGMQIRGKNVIISVSLEELRRRVSGLTKQSGEPRRLSNFRKHD